MTRGAKPRPRWPRVLRRAELRFNAPDVAKALAALEEGERPDDRTTRAALRQLRHARRIMASRGPVEENAQAFRWMDDHIDVLRWVLTQPVAQPIHYCGRCNRRPARMGDHCKRCADELGIRPRGRI